jgi:REP element-mobilizing transposase RayT
VDDTAFFHVTTRGALRQTIFFDRRDYERLLRYLATAIERFDWTCHAYCLLPNHFHLLIELSELNLGRGMLLLNGAYARYFNRKYKRDGHVFDRKYHAEPVCTDEHLLESIRSIANNPVKARLCDAPGDWKWSSYRATAGLDPAPTWLTVDFVRRTCDPFGGYETFCNQIAIELQSDCGIALPRVV